MEAVPSVGASLWGLSKEWERLEGILIEPKPPVAIQEKAKMAMVDRVDRERVKERNGIETQDEVDPCSF